MVSFLTTQPVTISSTSNQTFAKNDSSTLINDFTITDTTPATIKTETGIRIKIPAGLNAEWDQSIVSVTASGSAYVGGKVAHYSYNKAVRALQDITVATLHVKGGAVERVEVGDPGITAANISQEKWGLRTEQYVRVSAVILSPNYWGGKPKVDEVIFELYTNSDTMAQDLKLGTIDAKEAKPWRWGRSWTPSCSAGRMSSTRTEANCLTRKRTRRSGVTV